MSAGVLGGNIFNQGKQQQEETRNPADAIEDEDTDVEVRSMEDVANDIQHVARRYSVSQSLHDYTLRRHKSEISEYYDVGKSPFAAEAESVLDPLGPNFNARAWVRALMSARKEDTANPGRKAGIAFKDLCVEGDAVDSGYQKSVSTVVYNAFSELGRLFGIGRPAQFQILQNLEGVVNAGEMLVVLGPPGSGCSTFLKTISGETHGFKVAKSSNLNYQGITAQEMSTRYKGEAIYTAETDVHFPNLSVGDTLYFAARARMPRVIPQGLSRKEFAEILRNVVMATFGISHTLNTKVGNDFVRGVSGGERKRVTIAEAVLGGSPIQIWDNSTRGLDSANAIEFCKTLRLGATYFDSTPLVAIYQSPQEAYDCFDKVLVLYEGRQIFFGSTTEAKDYFVNLGFECPHRQTIPDFLTSMTSPIERIYRAGWENKAPRTPDEFAASWKASSQRARLLEEIEEFNNDHPIGGPSRDEFEASRRAQKAKNQPEQSPYTLSYVQQVELCLWRGFRRLVGDPEVTLTQLIGNSIMALIVASVFYNLAPDTDSFFQRGALLFFSVLLNAFGSALEILTLYAQRPIVEKHARYAFYHPSAEAFASMLTDMPYKIANALCFNLIIYFMSNLRRDPGHFFFFLLLSFFLTLAMSMFFRTIASVSRTLSQAMTPAALLILGIVMFTGFAIPVKYMHGWSRWINYIDPVAYGFEALMVNEFHDRNYSCSTFVPSYGDLASGSKICTAVGSIAGQSVVGGDAYLADAYGYSNSHKWRNLGIVIAFMVALLGTYLAATEFIGAQKSKGEILIFRKGHKHGARQSKAADLEHASARVRASTATKSEAMNESSVIQKQTAIFHWSDICYDIKIKGEPRRILDHVDGWVRPGTLTALMGVSGAGKTTLLDALATRITMGVVTGETFVNGRECDNSFQRRTGYVQQQDLHLQTSTVREAIQFSALLRQPASVSRQAKIEYVEEVIRLLDMQEYADAVIGVPGEGLNVEQRKRLTIGVELAAKPDLLLFLDEPTSGLDSQTSWAICDLMEKLTKAGQAILCTVHQPSAMLFQRFDRLLFLAKGGKTIYFGDVGRNSSVLTSYFERNGSKKCPTEANPAEWMLEVIGAAPGSTSVVDWHEVWKNSDEYRGVKEELARLKENATKGNAPLQAIPVIKGSDSEFAVPFSQQLRETMLRVFEQYWRTPSYIFAKVLLCTLSSLFIGFVFFDAENTQQGLQNQLFSIFLLFTIFSQLAQQIMPHFVTQRALYEVRERPSKIYSWKAFMLSNIVVELAWNSLMAVIIFFCLYYPIGLYRNAIPDNQVHERGALFFLFVLQFLLFTSSFSTMAISGLPDAETAGNVANLAFSLCLIFCGVLASPQSLPGFWIFMYRVSPFTYLVNGMLAVGVANSNVICSDVEYLLFNAPSGQTCGEFMKPYVDAGGYLADPNATSCQFCTISSTNTFLAAVSSNYADRWRNFGILWAFIVFNIFAAVMIYWLARVPKKSKKLKQ